MRCLLVLIVYIVICQALKSPTCSRMTLQCNRIHLHTSTTLFASRLAAPTEDMDTSNKGEKDVSRKIFAIESDTGKLLEKIIDAPEITQYNDEKAVSALRYVDTSRGENFYNGVQPHVAEMRTETEKNSDINTRLNIDAQFNSLMQSGYSKRAGASKLSGTGRSAGGGGEVLSVKRVSNSPVLGNVMMSNAAKVVQQSMELGKSEDEMIREFKREQLSNRSAYMKLMPQFTHKYIDYLNSLRIIPNSKELTTNTLLGSFFAFVIWANQGLRSSFMYLVVGNLIVLSALLTRNMPRSNQAAMDLQQGRRKVATWSSTAFKTASAITLGFSSISALLMFIVTKALQLDSLVCIKASMIASVLGVSYFSSYYEVFEDKSKNGSRWKASQSGTKPESLTTKMQRGSKECNEGLNDEYQYSYDPEEAEYPRKAKFVDELPDNAPAIGENDMIDEEEEQDKFADWRAWRRESRRPPVEEAPPETPWVGSKAGMYVDNVPKWLKKSYDKNVLQANQWRGKPTRFIRDFAEFESVQGPLGFRDKAPQWLTLFGTGVWEEKTTASRRAARAFGSYRKTMWKLDEKVQLQPCDGADKDPHAQNPEKK